MSVWANERPSDWADESRVYAVAWAGNSSFCAVAWTGDWARERLGKRKRAMRTILIYRVTSAILYENWRKW